MTGFTAAGCGWAVTTGAGIGWKVGEPDGVWAGEVLTVSPLVVWLVPTVDVGVVNGVVGVRGLIASKVSGINGIGAERHDGRSACRDNWTRVAGAVELS